MALNFPIPISVGQVYQDPTSGNTYVCTSLGPPAQWVGSGSSTSLDSTYLRTDASNDPVTGNLLLNPSTNVSPLTLQQPIGNTTPALKIENSGSGNSIEANGFTVSNTGAITLGTALAIASGGTGATTQSAARTNLGATTVGNAVFIAADAAAARTAINAQEEFTYGTWTPAYSMSTSGSVTTEAASGEYFLIPPDYVYVRFSISSNALNSPVGTVRITLPFPGSVSTPVTFRVQAWGSSLTYLHGVVASNSTIREFISLRNNTPGQAASNVSNTDLATGTNVNFLTGAVLYRRFLG